jgi:hypothetical protein
MLLIGAALEVMAEYFLFQALIENSLAGVVAPGKTFERCGGQVQ